MIKPPSISTRRLRAICPPSYQKNLIFTCLTLFSEEEKLIIKALLEEMILTHEAKRWANV
jgi:hypothetical protein